MTFLNLVDSYHVGDEQLTALLRTLGLEGTLGHLIGKEYPYRGAGGAFTPVTMGLRGKKKEQIKNSLLWYAVGEYCQQLPQIINDMSAILSGQIRTALLQQGLIGKGAITQQQPFIKTEQV